jgi:hypothetical protein
MISQALPIAYNREDVLVTSLREFLGDGNYRIVQVSCLRTEIWSTSGLRQGTVPLRPLAGGSGMGADMGKWTRAIVLPVYMSKRVI